MGLIEIKLAYGTKRVVPDTVEILNREQEGKRATLYGACFIDPDKPEIPRAFDDGASGPGSHQYAYLTNFPDLFAIGRHDMPVLKSRYGMLVEDWKELWMLMKDAAERELPAGSKWAFAFGPYDYSGKPMFAGTSDAYVPMGGSRDEGR
jgi:hypothetical protein